MRVCPLLAEIGFLCRGLGSLEELRVAQTGLDIWSEWGGGVPKRSRVHWREDSNNPAASETKLKDEEGRGGARLVCPPDRR